VKETERSVRNEKESEQKTHAHTHAHTSSLAHTTRTPPTRTEHTPTHTHESFLDITPRILAIFLLFRRTPRPLGVFRSKGPHWMTIRGFQRTRRVNITSICHVHQSQSVSGAIRLLW
jgi:hypothetical protein